MLPSHTKHTHSASTDDHLILSSKWFVPIAYTIDDLHLYLLTIAYKNQQRQSRKHATSTTHAQNQLLNPHNHTTLVMLTFSTDNNKTRIRAQLLHVSNPAPVFFRSHSNLRTLHTTVKQKRTFTNSPRFRTECERIKLGKDASIEL